MWLKNDTKKYWVYIGQSEDVCRRIHEHLELVRRRHSSCLYYEVFRLTLVEDAFVILAEPPLTLRR